MNTVKVKVCGMTSIDQVRQLTTLGVDYAGFIFYEKSPRFIAGKIDPSQLKTIDRIQKVGVFVNASKEEIFNSVDTYGLQMVQLHGDESPEFCRQIKEATGVIKAFRIKGDESISSLTLPYQDAVDYFLFDTKAKEYGGTGKKFDWTALTQSSISKPYFLSGGIGLDDSTSVKEFISHQPVFALDVNSKFETAPGVKDMKMVEDFIGAVRKTASY